MGAGPEPNRARRTRLNEMDSKWKAKRGQLKKESHEGATQTHRRGLRMVREAIGAIVSMCMTFTM